MSWPDQLMIFRLSDDLTQRPQSSAQQRGCKTDKKVCMVTGTSGKGMIIQAPIEIPINHLLDLRSPESVPS